MPFLVALRSRDVKLLLKSSGQHSTDIFKCMCQYVRFIFLLYVFVIIIIKIVKEKMKNETE